MWLRTIAGLVPGFFLATALTALLCWLPPGPWREWLVPGLVGFAPVWTGVFIGAFVFASPRRAMLAYLLAAALANALFFGLRALAWIA